MAKDTKEVAVDLSPLIKFYKDGTVERLLDDAFVPPSPEPDPATGVSSKDITISPHVSARLYLPNLDTDNTQKLPIIVYFHGGGFLTESAFAFHEHRHSNVLASTAGAVAVSVEYRLAPEHPLPTAYEDCWAALQWVASPSSDPWLISHGDLDRVFIAGDSAGGNIAHNLAMRAGSESSKIKITGALLLHPYFWDSSNPSGSVLDEDKKWRDICYGCWVFAYPSAEGGIDNPMINPRAENAPSLAGLGISKMFVCTAEKDVLREKALKYAEAVKKSGWGGEIEVMDIEGEDHCFQVADPVSEKAVKLFKSIASFVNR